MRLGICAQPGALPAAAAAGFDFVELPLSAVADMEDHDFEEFVRMSDDYPLRAEVFYSMLPDGLHVTGRDVSAQALHDYLSPAFDRAKRLGGDVILLDGGAARSVPFGFDVRFAWRQMENFLRMLQGHARQAGLRVAVLPLRRAETNLLNYVSEATLISSLVQMDCIGVAADSRQMAMVSEPDSALSLAGPSLLHVRANNAMSGRLPAEGDGEKYSTLFRALIKMGYCGRVSCCGDSENFADDAMAARAALSKALSEALK